MQILIPALVLLAIAALCAILLVVSSALFGVKADERIAKIREELPGANCGACGYSGCDGYAKALAAGLVDNPSLCTPGGDGVIPDEDAALNIFTKLSFFSENILISSILY